VKGNICICLIFLFRKAKARTKVSSLCRYRFDSDCIVDFSFYSGGYLINIDDPPAAVLAVCDDGKIHQIICGISRPPESVHRLLPVEICPKRKYKT
jgi:hypothetical protein